MRDNNLVACMSVNPCVVIEYIFKTQIKDRILGLVILSGFIDVDKEPTRMIDKTIRGTLSTKKTVKWIERIRNIFCKHPVNLSLKRCGRLCTGAPLKER